tara:strand:- start:248 stop:973 length:726 start_codon:yes stop_codon:yes gene_type:complete
MTRNHSIAHPNPGHYDNRTGLGYGQTQNKYHDQRAVSSGEYGIYNPKGQWDKEIEQDNLVKKKSKKKKSKKNSKKKSKQDAKWNAKTFSSQFRDATDSLVKYNPFSFVGAAGAGHTTLNAHDEIEGEELLEKYIAESISGNYYIRRSGKGTLYPRHNVSSEKAAGMAPSYTRGGSHGHYKRTGNRFAVSGHTVYKNHDAINYDLDDESKTSWEIVNPDTYDEDQEHIENIEKHIRNILNLT